MKYKKIHWSPFRTNILDADRYDLCKPDGTPVQFRRAGIGAVGFELVVDGQTLYTESNQQMSAWMDERQIGGILKS